MLKKIANFAKSRKNKNIESSVNLGKGKLFESEYLLSHEKVASHQISGVEYTTSINLNMFISQDNVPELENAFELLGNLQSQYSNNADLQTAKISKK